MQMATVDLTPTTDEVKRIVSAVRDEQLAAPTPDEGTRVAGLLDHFAGLTVAFRMAAEKTPLEGRPTWDPDRLPSDWRTRIPEQLDALAAAWRATEAGEGEATAGGVTMPARVMVLVALNEVLLHGWDLAAATGQEYRPDPIAVERCLRFNVNLAENAPDVRDGMYGPRVEVPAGASDFDRLLAATGRDPNWRP
jgi:uncharacterized protein (TIGR03086 family)